MKAGAQFALALVLCAGGGWAQTMGASLGALRRDRTFFAYACETLIERLGTTGVANVPDAQARQGTCPGGR